MYRRLTIAIGLLAMLSAVIGGASYAITTGYPSAYYDMVLTDGGTVLPLPRAKPAAVPHVDEDPLKNIIWGPLR